MQKIVIILVLILITSFSFSQNSKVDILIREGIVLHDKGDYKGAIAKYDKALKIDKNKVTAKAEKTISLFSKGDYIATVKMCSQITEEHPDSKDIRIIYVTYGNALDMMKKPDRSVKIYEQGIEKFPDYYMLHFNKGITLTGLGQYEEAMECLYSSAKINPDHPGTQNAIGRMALADKNNIAAFLALSRFMVIEPTGQRAVANLEIIKKLFRSNVQKTGRNTITINLNPDLISSDEEEGDKKEVEENDFRTVELILTMSSALDFSKENKKKNEVELIINKLEIITSSLKNNVKDGRGFFWEYYAPYFIEMKEKDLLEPFAYLIFISSDKKHIKKWFDKNDDKIMDFYGWSKKYKWEIK